jgi:V8-like Glu-specific endopeptidase
VSTNDIIGGNSGSPLLDAQGQLVGLLFDGNIHAISGNFWYDAARNRAVSVHPAIMRVALTQVYDAGGLARELGL